VNSIQNGHAGRLLIVDEDDLTLRFLADNLTADNYTTSTAASAGAARIVLDRDPVDLVVVDVNGQTLGLLDSIRNGEIDGCSPDLALIVLAGHGDELHRTRLLEYGADDVQAKPFADPELRARIASVLRRATGWRRPAGVLGAGPVRIDVHHRQVTVHDTPVSLSRCEYQLLLTLVTEPERTFTRAELLRAVWGERSFQRSRTLDSHASRLRGMLAAAGAQRMIQNVWGVGYKAGVGP
jgi:DNA-binding response OmpR family regulator